MNAYQRWGSPIETQSTGGSHLVRFRNHLLEFFTQRNQLLDNEAPIERGRRGFLHETINQRNGSSVDLSCPCKRPNQLGTQLSNYHALPDLLTVSKLISGAPCVRFGSHRHPKDTKTERRTKVIEIDASMRMGDETGSTITALTYPYRDEDSRNGANGLSPCRPRIAEEMPIVIATTRPHNYYGRDEKQRHGSAKNSGPFQLCTVLHQGSHGGKEPSV